MQRVRIGLTGLAFVFLAVLLAAVFTGRTVEEAPITPEHDRAAAGPGAATQPAPAAQSPPESRSPTLGLAPANPESNARRSRRRTARRPAGAKPRAAHANEIHRLIHRTPPHLNRRD